MLKLSRVKCSIMEQQLIIHPGEFILYIQTGGEVSAQSGISLYICGYVSVFSEICQCVVLLHVPLLVRWSSMDS